MISSKSAIRTPTFALSACLFLSACSVDVARGAVAPPDDAAPEADLGAADMDGAPPTSATVDATVATAAPVVPPAASATATATATAPPATTVGSDTSAAAASPVLAPADELPVDGANLTVGSLTADGFTVTNLACKVEGGGFGMLMMGPAIAGSLSKKKAALNGCAPNGADVRARFTMAGGKVASAEAKAKDPKIEACVVRTLKTTPAAAEGTCAASMHLGK